MKTLSILLALSTPLFARLGETEKECTARYGDSSIEYGGERMYIKNRIEIRINFHEGKAEEISYRHRIADKELSDEEIQIFLALNAPEEEWIELPRKGEPIDWKRSSWKSASEKHGAEYSFRRLTIYLDSRMKRLIKEGGEARKKETEEKLKGF